VLSKFREDLLGQTKKTADDVSRVAGLDNQGIVGLQRQIIKGTDVWPVIIHAIATIKCSDDIKRVAGCHGWSVAFHFHRPRQYANVVVAC
jgi:hypothetical protein